MDIDKNNGQESKGFAVFSNLVFDVTVEPEPCIPKVTIATVPTREARAPRPESTLNSAYQAPASTNSGMHKGWVWGIDGTVVVFGLISANSGFSKPAQFSSSNYSDPGSTPACDTSHASNVEQMPLVGSGLTLSTNQLRCCVSEDIPITAIKDLINSYSSYEVDQFNADVSDWRLVGVHA